jgi:transcriptional regulator with XRE-family HTH domain
MKDKQSEKNPTDKHVGSRIRMRRMMLGLTQTDIATELGLTFQQVQKYEKGMNRIGASRLQHIAHILQVPVAFFFEDVLADEPTQKPTRKTAPRADINEFMATKDGLALAKAFMKISNVNVRQQIAGLVNNLGQSREAAD